MIGIAILATWFPEAASRHAARVDGAFYGVYFAAACALIFFVGLAVVQLRLYRRQDRNQQGAVTGRPNTILLAAWVLGAVGLALYAFVAGVPGFIDQGAEPYGAYEIDVTARQWGWNFTYPNGHVAAELHVPADRPVRLNLTTADVAHSLAVPALRINAAIVPGRETRAWFEATAAGKYDLQSNTFSGDGFADMKTALVVHDAAGFTAWLDEVSDIFKGRTMAEVGELLYTRHGCTACHSLDGSRLVGPSFKDLYGFEFDTEAGPRIVADDAYIRESIIEPNASVIKGFQPVMVSYNGVIDDKEIEAITAWLKTISSKGETAPAAEQEEN